MERIKFGTDGWRASIGGSFRMDEPGYTFENVRYCAEGTARYLIDSGQAGMGMVVGYDMRFRSEDFAAAWPRCWPETASAPISPRSPPPRRCFPTPYCPCKAAGGIWITASHNPPQDNGYKLRSSYAGAAAPETLIQVEAGIAAAQQAQGRVARMDYDRAVKEGLIQLIDPVEPYLEQLARVIDTRPHRRRRAEGSGRPHVGRRSWDGSRACWAAARWSINELHNERNPIFPRMKRPEPIDENLQRSRWTRSWLGVAMWAWPRMVTPIAWAW